MRRPPRVMPSSSHLSGAKQTKGLENISSSVPSAESSCANDIATKGKEKRGTKAREATWEPAAVFLGQPLTLWKLGDAGPEMTGNAWLLAPWLLALTCHVGAVDINIGETLLEIFRALCSRRDAGISPVTTRTKRGRQHSPNAREKNPCTATNQKQRRMNKIEEITLC